MSSSLPDQSSTGQSAPRSLSTKVSSMRFMQRAQDNKSAPKPTNQSTNQSTNRSQSAKPSNQSTSQTQPSNQASSQSTSQSPNQSTSQSTSQSINHSVPIIISAARRECSTEPITVQSSLGRRSFGSFNKHLEPQPEKDESSESINQSSESVDAFLNRYDNPDDMPRASKKFSNQQSNDRNDSRPAKKRKTGTKKLR